MSLTEMVFMCIELKKMANADLILNYFNTQAAGQLQLIWWRLTIYTPRHVDCTDSLSTATVGISLSLSL